MIKVEHGTFTPVVLSTYSGFGRETSCFVSRLAEKITEKQGTEKSVVSNYIRSKVSHMLVRSQVECIRGSKAKLTRMVADAKEAEVVNIRAEIKLRC